MFLNVSNLSLFLYICILNDIIYTRKYTKISKVSKEPKDLDIMIKISRYLRLRQRCVMSIEKLFYEIVRS